MTDVNLWMLVIDFALITLQESCGCAQLLGNLVRVCPPLRHAPQHPCGADAAVRPWNASLQISLGINVGLFTEKNSIIP